MRSIKALAFDAYERDQFAVVNKSVIEGQTESYEMFPITLEWAKHVKGECTVFMYFDKLFGWTQGILICYPSGVSLLYRVRNTVPLEELDRFRRLYNEHVLHFDP